MKKIFVSISAALMVLVMLASCGKAPAQDFKAEDIYQKVTEGISMPENTVELSADDLTDYYGIDSAKVSEFKAVQDSLGYKDEVVVIKAVDEAAASEIGAQLTEHIEYQKNSMKNYDAAQFDILGSSEVVVNGVYTAMFISAEQSKMIDTFNSLFQ